jgi:hypothetical protein
MLMALVIFGFIVVLLRSQEDYSKGLVMELHIAVLAMIALVIYWLVLRGQDFQKVEDIVWKVTGLFIFMGLAQFCVYHLFGVNLGCDQQEFILPGNVKLTIVCCGAEPGHSVFAFEEAPWFRSPSLFREGVLFGLLGAWYFAVSFLHLLLSHDKKWMWRCLLAAAAVIISASRAAMLACLVTMFTAQQFVPKSRRLGAFLVPLVLLLAVISVDLATGQGIRQFFQGRLEVGFAAEDIRWLMYKAQMENFLNNPLMGIGPGSTESVIRQTVGEGWEPETVPTGGYSTIFTMLSDLGLVGLGLFLAFIFKIYQDTRRTLQLFPLGLSPQGIYFFHGLLAMLVCGIFTQSVLGVGLFWFGVALAWTFIEKDLLLLDHS